MRSLLSFHFLTLLLLWSPTSSATSLIAKALIELTGAIAIDIFHQIQFIPQFANQFQFLANASQTAPLMTPIISLSAHNYENTTTSQALWGLSNINSLIQSVNLISHKAAIAYSYDSSKSIWTISFTDTADRRCNSYYANSAGLPYGTLLSSTLCNPTTWNIYKNVTSVSTHTANFFKPTLFDSKASYVNYVILPYSLALNNKNGTVITANASLYFLNDLLAKFVETDVLLYVMTNSNQGFTLLATSIGESLVSNHSTISALQSNNDMIRYSAQYWSQNSIRFTAGSSGSSGSFTSGGFEYLTAASLFKSYASLNLEWIVVAVILVGKPGKSEFLNVTIDEVKSNAASKVCEGIAIATVYLLEDFISYGQSLIFLTGYGSKDLNSPVLSVKQSNLTSVTQETLWGMSNAYLFASTSTFYGTYLVDQDSGGYDGYNGNYYYHRLMRQVPQCGSFKNSYGTTYAAVPYDCMRVYPITSTGVPSPPLSQLAYDPRNTSWYMYTKYTLAPVVYGTTNVPEGLSSTLAGVVFSFPVLLSDDFLGAVEFFTPSTVFAQSVSSIRDSIVNVSYIVDNGFYLLASSEQPTPSFVNANGTRLSALNSSNEIIRLSSRYLKSQSINTANTFFMDYSSSLYFSVTLRPIDKVQSVSVYWKVVSVSVESVKSSSEAVYSPTASPSSSPANNHDSDVFIAGIVMISVGFIVLIASSVIICRIKLLSKPSATNASATTSSANASEPEVRNSMVEIISPMNGSMNRQSMA